MDRWLERAAARHPERVAVEGPARSLTYRSLLEEVRPVACALAGGHGPVAVALAPGEEYVVALHACLLACRAIQPVDLRLSAPEQEARRAGAGTLLDGPLPVAAEAPAPPPPPHSASPEPEDVVAVLHTSGTTAAPKPVRLTRANFLASALGSAVALGLDLEERWLCPMPLTHVGGLSIPIRSAIYASTVVLHGRFSVEAVLEELMDPRRRITLVSLVPTMLARLLDAGLERPPTLRWALLGGGPIAPALLARAAAAGVPVAPTYGMTEACSQIATFGWPLPGVQVRLAGPLGEILVRGAIVAPGAVSCDGWLHTGDLGAVDERGRLVIAGRAAETIVTGGENVSPTEVEAVLLEHPAVADAGVFGRPDAEWGEAVWAAVVLRAELGAEVEELLAFCRGRLARFKVPKGVVLSAELPRTASGKLLRRRLVAEVESAAPR
jgi:O-succinylbenzoic acid--CoA ligase